MELDEIKKLWNEIDTLKGKQQISDNRIKEMLKNEGKTALAKLIRIKKIGMILIIPLGILFCLISYNFFEAGGYYMICPLFFLFYCLLMEPLVIYLYRLLNKINFSNMSVREVSEKILNYHKIIQKCQLLGIVFFIVFMGIWIYSYYKLVFGSEIIWWFIIYCAALYIAGLIAIPILYKKLYFNNINRIKASLKELKEFED
jgi:hypothetical protein